MGAHKSNELQDAADCLVSDLNMLMEGSWVPDDDSCQASIDNAVLLAGAMPQLLKARKDVSALLSALKEIAFLDQRDGRFAEIANRAIAELDV